MARNGLTYCIYWNKETYSGKVSVSREKMHSSQSVACLKGHYWHYWNRWHNFWYYGNYQSTAIRIAHLYVWNALFSRYLNGVSIWDILWVNLIWIVQGGLEMVSKKSLDVISEQLIKINANVFVLTVRKDLSPI